MKYLFILLLVLPTILIFVVPPLLDWFEAMREQHDRDMARTRRLLAEAQADVVASDDRVPTLTDRVSS